MEAESLNLGQVFLLDCGEVIFIWCGSRSSLMSRSKARLLAEKINKFERKGHSKIIQLRPVGSLLFLPPPHHLITVSDYRGWSLINSGTFSEENLRNPFQWVPFPIFQTTFPHSPILQFREYVYVPRRPILYRVGLGTGYLELPQGV